MIRSGHDPVAEVDAEVAAIAPRLAPPAVQRLDAVLVTGRWLAGVSSVVTALGKELPEYTFVEPEELAAGQAPTAVVIVVSAAAVLTESDCALIDAAAADTDVVIGVVSKIDLHRQWREVLAADRDALATYAERYRHVHWVGVAAAPEHGAPRVGELVTAIREQLAAPEGRRRNRLRAWESRLQEMVSRCERDAEGSGRRVRVAALREQRSIALRERRMVKSERTIGLRSQLQQARIQLSYFARNRCASVRTELQEDAAGLTRRNLPGFETYARGRADDVVTEVDEGCAIHLAGMARSLGLSEGFDPVSASPPPGVEFPRLPLRSRQLETRLMMLLGAGFGLGVALTLSRLLAGVASRLTLAGFVACVAVGLALTVWVVGTRSLLHDRAVLDRWVGEVTAALRGAAEQLVATRVLVAESALTAALGRQEESDAVGVADQVSVIDAELREHAIADARAAALRNRELPTLQGALRRVRAELANRMLDPRIDGPTGAVAAAAPAGADYTGAELVTRDK